MNIKDENVERVLSVFRERTLIRVMMKGRELQTDKVREAVGQKEETHEVHLEECS